MKYKYKIEKTNDSTYFHVFRHAMGFWGILDCWYYTQLFSTFQEAEAYCLSAIEKDKQNLKPKFIKIIKP